MRSEEDTPRVPTWLVIFAFVAMVATMVVRAVR